MAMFNLVKPAAFRKFAAENEDFFKKAEEMVNSVDSVSDEKFLKWAQSEECINFLDCMQKMQIEVCINAESIQCFEVPSALEADVAFRLLMDFIPKSFKASNRNIIIVRADDFIHVIDRKTGSVQTYSISGFIKMAIPGYDQGSLIQDYFYIAKNYGFYPVFCLVKLESILRKCLRANFKAYGSTSLLSFDSRILLSTMHDILRLKNSLC